MRFRTAILVVLTLCTCQRLHADERLKGIACRSVHLQYFQAPVSDMVTTAVTVQKSAPGTYFCALGFHHGYFGIQELANGKKVVLFSVWDPGNRNDPNKVPEEHRVRLLYRDKAVRIGRFGNEGTGGQSFFDVDWQPGKQYRFLITSRVNEAGNRTAYSSFFAEEGRPLRHLVTFDRPTQGEHMRGFYSFVEDFRRNRESTKQTRTAEFFAGWVRPADGDNRTPRPLRQARFTADANPVMNINAGSTRNRFFLSTGGSIKNDATSLREVIRLVAFKDQHPPQVPQARFRFDRVIENDKPQGETD